MFAHAVSPLLADAGMICHEYNRLHDRRKLMFRECCLEDVSGGANDPNARWMDAASGEFNVIRVRDMLKGGVREQ